MADTDILALPVEPTEIVGSDGMRLREYEHPLGFRIVVLINGDPEMFAALGATLSRDPAPLRVRFAELTLKQRDRIIGRYFRNYGHDSIGEMGHLTLAVEDVSMYGALRTIEFARFQGQEASTRYIDFSETRYLLPPSLRDNTDAHDTVKGWFSQYRSVLDMLKEEFRKQGMEPKDAEPKAFDIAGAFLPLAARTSVVLTCDIRNLIEHAWEMQSYLGQGEITAIGDHLLRVINHVCPNSVKERDPAEFNTRASLRDCLKNHAFLARDERLVRSDVPESAEAHFALFDTKRVCSPYIDNLLRLALDSRLSDDFLGRFGTIRCTGSVSMRSLRDLWRHRPYAKSFSLPAESEHVRFAGWYFDQIPSLDKRNEVVHSTAGGLTMSRVYWNTFSRSQDILYFLPMGVEVFFEMNGTLDKWLYLLRLRSGVRVHPEVRTIVHAWIRRFASTFGISTSRLGDMSDAADYGKRSEDK